MNETIYSHYMNSYFIEIPQLECKIEFEPSCAAFMKLFSLREEKKRESDAYCEH